MVLVVAWIGKVTAAVISAGTCKVTVIVLVKVIVTMKEIKKYISI